MSHMRMVRPTPEGDGWIETQRRVKSPGHETVTVRVSVLESGSRRIQHIGGRVRKHEAVTGRAGVHESGVRREQHIGVRVKGHEPVLQRHGNMVLLLIGIVTVHALGVGQDVAGEISQKSALSSICMVN